VGEAGDRGDDHGRPPAGAKVADLAGDLQDVGGVREAEVVDGDGLEGAQLDPAVGLVAGAVAHGQVVPGQSGAAVQQGGLVGLDGQQVVGLLVGDQELGVGVGVQRVLCRGHRYAEVAGGAAAVGGNRAGEVGIITGFRGRR
jgi:hypothetical protein